MKKNLKIYQNRVQSVDSIPFHTTINVNYKIINDYFFSRDCRLSIVDCRFSLGTKWLHPIQTFLDRMGEGRKKSTQRARTLFLFAHLSLIYFYFVCI